jgi:hypothetical protein
MSNKQQVTAGRSCDAPDIAERQGALGRACSLERRPGRVELWLLDHVKLPDC